MSRFLKANLKSFGGFRGVLAQGRRSALLTTARFFAVPSGLHRVKELAFKVADLNPLSPVDVSIEERLRQLGVEDTEDARQMLKRFGSKMSVQFSHIESDEERQFLCNAMEEAEQKVITEADQRRTLHIMAESEALDLYLASKYAGFKRYSGEGCESLLPGIDAVLSYGSKRGIEDVVIGMPHRGRFNLLVGLLQFPARALFRKVDGHSEVPDEYSVMPGDVTSHLAQSVTLEREKPIHVSLLHNPSHLEAINPVAAGKCRRRQEMLEGSVSVTPENRRRVLPLVIHGDAAFAGQGIVAETMNMAYTPGFDVGGTLHIIVNNQVGFTAEATTSRSSRFAADLAKGIGAPIIIVNGDDPEAARKAMEMAVDFRQKFNKDVFVEIMCYRRHGHNELDEPSFTQPTMYRNIRSRKSPPTVYAEKLEADGVIDSSYLEQIKGKAKDTLDKEKEEAEAYKTPSEVAFAGKWKDFGLFSPDKADPETGMDTELLKKIALASVTVPENVKPHQRLERLFCKNRRKIIEQGKPIDWATAEAMAFGSLLSEGKDIRMSGQDVERGTFSHRHALFVCQETDEKYSALSNLPESVLQGKRQGLLSLHSSLLSEEAVLGFEYGYSINDPNQLTLWEAQFGDFFNGAQIIFDNFITSSEAKWLRQTGLTVLLPHGFDGTGPEHSSCRSPHRMERFLQLSDDGLASLKDSYGLAREVPGDSGDGRGFNLSVVNPTLPAQYYHLLRRQVLTPFRKPMVVVAPKTLIRHPKAVSLLEEFGPGTKFRYTIAEAITREAQSLVFCSGKIYYDLVAQREEAGVSPAAAPIVRLEQLSPFPMKEVRQAFEQFCGNRVAFVQEEPENNGALSFVLPRLNFAAKEWDSMLNVDVVSRPPIASVAVGSSTHHKQEVAQLAKSFKGYLTA